MRRRLKSGTIQRARRLRRDETDMEGLLWWKLRELNAHGYHFRRQVPLRSYFLDFAEHSARLAIELDGNQHGFRQNIEHDRERDRIIAEEGYLILRFWNVDVKRNLDGVVEAISRELVKRRPPPGSLRSPTSPQGGGDWK
jgi:very-short-patch-repair endonuclease